MLRKILNALILIPLALVLVVFAVANREWVTVSLDPLNKSDPALSFTLPLFVLLIGVAILGVVAGGMATWLRQGSWRRAARHNEAELRRLQLELMARDRREAAAPHADSGPATAQRLPPAA